MRAVALVLAALLVPASAAADVGGPMPDYAHVAAPHELCVIVDGQNFGPCAPGYFLSASKWAALDLETRRLQDAETRLTAEVATYKAQSPNPPKWFVVISAIVVGAALGAYVEYRLQTSH